jgi:hypothetical protein
MGVMYTKQGVPVTVSGSDVYGPSGRQFGRISGKRVFGPDGRYVATIVGDRLIYRSTDAAVIGSSFAPSRTAASGYARAVATADWGDEPDIGQ